jgi:hypothetical protein
MNNTQRLRRGLSWALAHPFDTVLYVFATIAPIFFLPSWNMNMAQGWFFVFGTLTLLGIGLSLTKKAKYCNISIGLIILWSLFGILFHTFKFSLSNSIASSFLNFALLSEGFIYILCGCLLYWLTLNYSDSFDIFYPILLINIANLIVATLQAFGFHPIWPNAPSISGMMGTNSRLTLFSAISIPILGHKWYPLVLIPLILMFFGYSFTGILAFFLVVCLYLYLRHQRVRLIVVFLLGLLFSFTNHTLLLNKLFIRLEVWKITLNEIISHPFIGNGFDNSLTMNMVYCSRENAMVYRHNDYLNLISNLGLPIIVLLDLFLYEVLKGSKLNYLFVSILILLVSLSFQTNFYFAGIAVVGIILLAYNQKRNQYLSV